MSIGAISGGAQQPPSFSTISSNGKVITKTDLENDIQKHGGTKDQADQLYSKIAGSSDGISQSDWTKFTSQIASGAPGDASGGGSSQQSAPPSLDDLFKNYGDENGKLTKKALEKAFKDHGKTAEQADQLWNKVAGNNSSITEDQFKSALSNQSPDTQSAGTSGGLVSISA